MNVIPLLTPERIEQMRVAQQEYVDRRRQLSSWARDQHQGASLAHLLMRWNDEVNAATAIIEDLDALHRRLTNTPDITHGNADLASESAVYPLSRDQQATEACRRG